MSDDDRRDVPPADRRPETDPQYAGVVGEGTTGGLLQDKMVGEDVLRDAAQADQSNPNDQPGFQDGILGGSDFEDRQGEPNSETGSDLGGSAHGGEGTERSGGVDGGPARTRPLPGQKK